MRKLSHADYVVMPWKNGGGVTTQLAIDPAGADVNSFNWRISMAQVSRSGPFSLFPGVDRSLAIVEGMGLKLFMPGRLPLQINDASMTCTFSGDWDIDSILVDGDVTDFNVLTRRDAWTHKLERLRLHGNVVLEGADDLFVYCVLGKAQADDVTIAAGESLQTGPCATLGLCASVPSLLYLVRLYQKMN